MIHPLKINKKTDNDAKVAQIIKENIPTAEYMSADEVNAMVAKINEMVPAINVSNGGFQGTLSINEKRVDSGFYIPQDDGKYINAGDVVVDRSKGFHFVTYDGDKWDVAVVPIVADGKVEEGNAGFVSGGEVFSYVKMNEKSVQLGFKDVNRSQLEQAVIYENINFIKVYREFGNDLMFSSVSNSSADEDLNTFRIRDFLTKDSLLLSKDTVAGLRKYSLEGGGYIELDINFMNRDLQPYNSKNGNGNIVLNKYFFEKITDYPKLFTSPTKYYSNDIELFYEVISAIKYLKIENADEDYNYSFNIIKRENQMSFYVTKRLKTENKSLVDCGSWNMNPNGDFDIMNSIIKAKSIHKTEKEITHFEVDFSKLRSDAYGSKQGFNDFLFYVSDSYLDYPSKNIEPPKIKNTTSNFTPFKMDNFDGRWYCNPNEDGYNEATKFIDAAGDTVNLLSNLYEPLRAKHGRYVTRTEEPIYSIMGQNNVLQHAYIYYFIPEKYSKTIFINTGTHSRESEGWLGVAKMLDLIYNHYEGNEVLTYLRFNVRFIVNPILNVWGASVFPRSNDFNANGVNLNRNFPNGHTPSDVAGQAPLDQIESKAIWEEILKYKNEIDFLADCHTTVNTGYGDYSLDFGDKDKFGSLIDLQESCVGYLITKNIVENDKRRQGLSNREENIPWQPYYGVNAYKVPTMLARACRDILDIQASTVEHSDFVWWLGQPYSQGLGTSHALKKAVELNINMFYNVAKNII